VGFPHPGLSDRVGAIPGVPGLILPVPAMTGPLLCRPLAGTSCVARAARSDQTWHGLQLHHDERSLTRWRNSIIAAFALGGITVSTWGPRLPAVRSRLRAGGGTIGLVLACATAGSISDLPCAPTRLQRLGGRRAISSSLLAVAATLGVMAGGIGVHSAPVLAAGFTIVGFGLKSLDIGINVNGSGIERESRAHVPATDQ